MSDSDRAPALPGTGPQRHRTPLLLQIRQWQLLIVSLLLIAVYVFRHTGGLFGAAVDVLDEVLLATAMFLAMSASRVSRRVWIAHILVAAVGIGIATAGVISDSDELATVANIIGGYMVVVTLVLVLRLALQHRRVTADTLFGATAVYLSLGVLFGIVYTGIATLHGGSFSPDDVVADGSTELYYFSFVTLTGLGYGDITPVAESVQILSTLEAVFGVILLAALVGRIVGLLVAQDTSIRPAEGPPPEGSPP